MKVFVYWNIHAGCWSIRCCKTKKVIEHLHSLTLTNATFKVSEAGRQRVIREKRKNVHAGVQGELSHDNPFIEGIPVRYNPYTQPTFTSEGQPIFEAACVHFYNDRQVRII
jgi:hypothetical protein